MFAPLTRRGPRPRMAARDAGVRVAAGQIGPAPATAVSRRRTITMPRLLPHNIQLCIHCRHNPAEFWVSRPGDQTVRRPWCLACCQDLDPACYQINPFDGCRQMAT